MSEEILKVENLKTYFFTASGVSKAVDGVSYTLRKGEILGIVGESGSGKSVSASSVIRLLPKTGKVVDGKKEYIVIGNENGEAEWAVASDTGTNRSDDHGQTFTVTCGYQIYPITKWYGTIEQEDAESVSSRV